MYLQLSTNAQRVQSHLGIDYNSPKDRERWTEFSVRHEEKRLILLHQLMHCRRKLQERRMTDTTNFPRARGRISAIRRKRLRMKSCESDMMSNPRATENPSSPASAKACYRVC